MPPAFVTRTRRSWPSQAQRVPAASTSTAVIQPAAILTERRSAVPGIQGDEGQPRCPRPAPPRARRSRAAGSRGALRTRLPRRQQRIDQSRPSRRRAKSTIVPRRGGRGPCTRDRPSAVCSSRSRAAASPRCGRAGRASASPGGRGREPLGRRVDRERLEVRPPSSRSRPRASPSRARRRGPGAGPGSRPSKPAAAAHSHATSPAAVGTTDPREPAGTVDLRLRFGPTRGTKLRGHRDRLRVAGHGDPGRRVAGFAGPYRRAGPARRGPRSPRCRGARRLPAARRRGSRPGWRPRGRCARGQRCRAASGPARRRAPARGAAAVRGRLMRRTPWRGAPARPRRARPRLRCPRAR